MIPTRKWIDRRTMAQITALVVLCGSIGAQGDDGNSPTESKAATLSRIVAGPMLTLDTRANKVNVWLATEGGGALYCGWGESGGGQPLVPGRPDWEFVCGRASEFDSVTVPIVDAAVLKEKELCLKFTPWRRFPSAPIAADELLCEMACRRIPSKGESGRFTFAFGSCSHQERFGEHQPIWTAIAKEAPDCFFFIGDNIYLPSKPESYPATRDAVLDFYRERYDHQRRMPELQSLLRSTYCFGIWDDHDYGPNNADKNWSWKDVAFEVFKEYFPGTYGLPDAPGCFQKFSWGDVDIFLLDDRSFRDPNDSPKPDKTMFGDAQLAWLKHGLAASTAKVKLIVNGNQMLSDKHPHESWGTYFRPERDAFLRWLWDQKIGGVFFLAGDRHFAELIHKQDPKGVGPDLWELTSSPLANGHFKQGGMLKNKERVAKYVGGVNYGVVRVDTTATPPTVELIVNGVEGNPVIEHRVRIARVQSDQ